MRSQLALPAVSVAAVLLLGGCGGAEPDDAASASSSTQPESPASAEPEPADTAVGGIDEPVLTNGSWTSAEKGDPYLEFNESKKVTGTDGCNAIASTWSVSGDSVTIEPFISTQKACPGVDPWLRDVSSVTVNGDTMSVKNISGDSIGELTKADG